MSEAHDLVREWLEVVDHGRTGQYNPDCQATKVFEDTYVWCDMHMDQDYQNAYLLEVQTRHPVDNTSISVVDYLMAYDLGSGKLEVEWYGEPRLFFDRDTDYHEQVCEYFVSWVYEIIRMRAEEWEKTRTPEQIASTKEYNAKVERSQRDLAAKIGIHLPAKGEPTSRERTLSALSRAVQRGAFNLDENGT